MDDVEIGNQMGVNTSGTFAGSNDKAVVDGDFAMKESELQPVLRALRKAGSNVVAIHQHVVGEQLRIMFLHYWPLHPSAISHEVFDPHSTKLASNLNLLSGFPMRVGRTGLHDCDFLLIFPQKWPVITSNGLISARRKLNVRFHYSI
jgi:uncharacterized protein DUF1259